MRQRQCINPHTCEGQVSHTYYLLPDILLVPSCSRFYLIVGVPCRYNPYLLCPTEDHPPATLQVLINRKISGAFYGNLLSSSFFSRNLRSKQLFFQYPSLISWPTIMISTFPERPSFPMLARLMEARNTLDLRMTWAPVTEKLRPLIPLMLDVVTINSWTKGVPRILLRNSQKSCNRSISLSIPIRPWQHYSLP